MFIYLYKLLQDSNKKLALLFDGHSRSKAWIQLIAILSVGLADKSLLAKFSGEFRAEIDPGKHDYKMLSFISEVRQNEIQHYLT